VTTADGKIRSSVLGRWRRHRSFVLYSVIGCSGVLLDLLVFLVLYNVFGMHEQLATAISTTLGIVNNFLLNSFFNFRVRDGMLRRFLRFYAVGIVGIGITAALLGVFSTWLGVDPNIVKVVALPAVVAFQFTTNRKWSFG
jgi:putative flippase GtrA